MKLKLFDKRPTHSTITLRIDKEKIVRPGVKLYNEIIRILCYGRLMGKKYQLRQEKKWDLPIIAVYITRFDSFIINL